MPIMKKDPHSGAIVFHPTKDEQEIKSLKDDLLAMKQELADILDKAKEKK